MDWLQSKIIEKQGGRDDMYPEFWTHSLAN